MALSYFEMLALRRDKTIAEVAALSQLLREVDACLGQANNWSCENSSSPAQQNQEGAKYRPSYGINDQYEWKAYSCMAILLREMAGSIFSRGHAVRSDIFDEEFYLAENEDVALAIKEGHFSSGFEHWILHGLPEGRLGRARTVDADTLSQNLLALFRSRKTTRFGFISRLRSRSR